MIAHEFKGQAVVAFPKDQPSIQARAHLIPPAFEFADAGTRVGVRRAKDLLGRGDGAPQFAPIRGGEFANRRQEAPVDADVLHARDFGSNLPLKRV